MLKNFFGEQIEKIVFVSQEQINDLRERNIYRAAGSEWNDSKYQQLGTVVNQAVSAIKAPISELESAIQKIKKMEADLRNYLGN